MIAVASVSEGVASLHLAGMAFPDLVGHWSSDVVAYSTLVPVPVVAVVVIGLVGVGLE